MNEMMDSLSDITPEQITEYRAVISGSDGRIVAVLSSDQPITVELLNQTPFAGMEYMEITKEGTEYQAGTKLAEYTEDGKLRPLLDRVVEGLCDPPPGYELVDGELVEVNPKPEEMTEHLQDTIDQLRAQVAALQKAALGV